ncbi:transcriptional coactivator p15 [Chlorella sorokiniana]|uniref:Transcriptional coactivator p15 n=1 Tax=Chlorella sorokiniana TaxID=3076 RepID=A0A2P6TC32_CHLSO|nr:transcriptional coactivator p15 [Chlorella sorokiniana]|eukprot:PRW20186.1 transcriptional coactivator p15 [Chlorella sorokiniana]
MAADARIVKQRLRALLRTVDFETETQRTITAKLENELGMPLSAHKPLIKEEIDQFLSEQQDEEDNADDDFEPEPAPKKARQERGPAPTAPAGDCVVPLSAKRFASVRTFGGRLMADVREFYEKNGQLMPGSKGVALQAAGWAALAAAMPQLTAGLEARDESVFVDLGSNKRASVSGYKGRFSLDIREFWEKDGEMLPGKKGVALTPDEWDKLCAAAPQVSQRLQAGGSQAGGSAAAAAAAGGAGSSGKAAARGTAGGVAAAPAAPVAAAGAGGVELSGTRRADVSTFKGTTYINIREYYEKDGQKLPGKKGISLPRDQFEALRRGADDLDAALRGRDTSFEVQLSNKRRASVSCFKGRYMVNIREYYEKDGQQLPGQKGISLPEEQWTRLLGGLPGLAAALDAA